MTLFWAVDRLRVTVHELVGCGLSDAVGFSLGPGLGYE
jgi:hypothetical protein